MEAPSDWLDVIAKWGPYWGLVFALLGTVIFLILKLIDTSHRYSTTLSKVERALYAVKSALKDMSDTIRRSR